MEAQPARYVVMEISCPNSHCQIVHVQAGTGFVQMAPQTVECLKCHELFQVMLPDRIVGGPFPSES
jgi:hypothetical protein